jgi:hypothetical protein
MSRRTIQHPANTPVRFQLLSDLHLEFPLSPHKHQYDTYTITPQAPYLLLCGDIGLFAQLPLFISFLWRISNDFLHVFLVLGNHEFYRVSRSAGLQTADEMERQLDGKLTVLHRRRVDIGDVTLLGCTLHSKLDPEQVHRITMGLNDFALVGEWGPAEYMREHEADLMWLKAELEEVEEGRRVIVATHHAPATRGTSNPAYDSSPFRSAFATELVGDVAPGRVKVWAFGHTHWCCDFVEGGVRVVANQGGYSMGGKEGKGEGGTKGFEKEFVVEV